MGYTLANVAGFAGAGLGWMAAGLTAVAILAALGMPPSTSVFPDTFHLLNQLGAMAGFLIAIGLVLRLTGQARSMREGARSSLVIAAALAVIFAAGSNLRLSAMEHLGLNAGTRAIEFEIRLPPVIATGSSKREAQVELHTDVNQTIALLRGGDGAALLRGTVPIEFRTAERTLILNMPGQPQRLFKVRLAANPSRTSEFSPWHSVDAIASTKGDPKLPMPDDNFAIRYRVI